jgi:hypothetical protein
MLLDFSVSGVAMGGEGKAERPACRAAIHAVSPLERIEVLKDGEVAYAEDADGLDATVEWTDPEPSAGEHSYYVHVIQADGQQAWASPVWVTT